MKSTSFIDFSCWIIQHAEHNLRDYDAIVEELTAQFWPATKVRNQRWNKSLDALEPSIQSAKPNDDCWGCLLRTCDEIILSEALSRVWFALIITRTANVNIIDIAQCIIPDHVRTRKRALAIWDLAPGTALEFAQRTKMVKAIRDQVNDLLLSQIAEEAVGRNLSLSFATFDKFFSCRYDYDAEVLKKAQVKLSRTFAADIAKLSPFDCVNTDLNMKTLISICSSFEEADDWQFPKLVVESASA